MIVPKFLKATGGMVSWGLQDSAHGFNAYSNDPAAYVDECHNDGIDWHCIQVSDQNLDGGIALCQAARSRSFHFGGWWNVAQENPDLDSLHHSFDLFTQMKCGFAFFNIEERWPLGGTDMTYEDPNKINACHYTLATEFRKRFPKTPAAVQTNFGGFEKREPGGVVNGYDTHAAMIYYKRNIFNNHEDYWVNDVNLTPINGDFNAHNNCQWPRPSSSTAGIFASETGRTDDQGNRLVNTISSEIPRLKQSGRHHVEWIWTMEYMTDQDRTDLRVRGRNF